MVEEHDQIGRPFQCAGLVNPGAMKKVVVRIYSPNENMGG